MESQVELLSFIFVSECHGWAVSKPTVTNPDFNSRKGGRGGGGGGSSVGRASDFWSGRPGFDPRCGRPLPTGWVGVSIM